MQKPRLQSKFTINGPVGGLEALLETPREGSPAACVVVCHPHPMHGGTMQNKVASSSPIAWPNRRAVACSSPVVATSTGTSYGTTSHSVERSSARCRLVLDWRLKGIGVIGEFRIAPRWPMDGDHVQTKRVIRIRTGFLHS